LSVAASACSGGEQLAGNPALILQRLRCSHYDLAGESPEPAVGQLAFDCKIGPDTARVLVFSSKAERNRYLVSANACPDYVEGDTWLVGPDSNSRPSLDQLANLVKAGKTSGCRA
jgi:hypothetical protein